MKLILIAALNLKRVIGVNGHLPWHISEDLKRFKLLTTGHTVLMGRRTFESIGRSLPNRRNIVLASRPISGIETFPSLDTALDALKCEEKVFVVGGGYLYACTLERADVLLLTIVENECDGDTFFPPYEEFLSSHCILVAEERHDSYVFREYLRKTNIAQQRK